MRRDVDVRRSRPGIRPRQWRRPPHGLRVRLGLRGEGGDTIAGGANGTSNFDELFGQDGPDNLQDEGIGGDSDQLCGGNNDDVLNTYDGDNRDNLIGEGGSDSLYDGTDSDFEKQDGVCV